MRMSKSSSDGGRRVALAMRAPVALMIFGVVCWFGGQVATGAETPSTTAEETPSAGAEDGKAKDISAAEYLAGVAKPGMTDAERAKFAAKYDGQKVTWTGYVRAVSRNKSADGDSFLLILKEKPVADPPPAAFVVWLGLENEKSVEGLSEDKKVSVSGTLFVQRDPKIPQLKDAKLVE